MSLVVIIVLVVLLAGGGFGWRSGYYGGNAFGGIVQSIQHGPVCLTLSPGRKGPGVRARL
ncbi:MAG: hypothetical protein H7Z10_13245 [Gemmatimonadaceae bacterium]|nr:hypothetical protein [Acetobacteraceae bacterium]